MPILEMQENDLSVQMVIELQEPIGAQAVVQAVESYKARLRASIQRTQRRLDGFEGKYNTSTDYFLTEMTAEDMQGGDLEYVEWAGEAKLLNGLEAELNDRCSDKDPCGYSGNVPV